MFNVNATSVSSKNHVAKSNLISNGELVDPRKSARNEHSRRRHHHHHHHHRIREEMSSDNDNHMCMPKLKAIADNNGLDKNSNRHSITIMDAEPTHRFENGNW